MVAFEKKYNRENGTIQSEHIARITVVMHWSMSIKYNNFVPMSCCLFTIRKPYNQLCAVVPDNLSVTNTLAVLYKRAVCTDDV